MAEEVKKKKVIKAADGTVKKAADETKKTVKKAEEAVEEVKPAAKKAEKEAAEAEETVVTGKKKTEAAKPVGNAKGLRIGAIVLWVAAIAFEIVAVFTLFGKINISQMHLISNRLLDFFHSMYHLPVLLYQILPRNRSPYKRRLEIELVWI